MRFSRLFLVIAAALLGAAPAPNDPMHSLAYLVGNWNCSYAAGGRQITYAATFSYAMGNNWMRERDTWTGGGGDEALVTFDPVLHVWTAIVMESERTTTMFTGKGTEGSRILYQSVYPNRNASEIFTRVSSTKYTLRFTFNASGKRITSNDTCTKQSR